MPCQHTRITVKAISVNSFTENTDKYSIFSEVKHSLKCSALDSVFSERFTETMHDKEINFSEQFVNYIKLNTVF